MTWVLKILLHGSNKAGLLKFWIKDEQIFLRLRGMQRREYLESELVCLTHRLWTVADAPSHVSHRRTIHRRCSKIFCTTSHTVGDNKLCGIYLIFHLDLNYIMGSHRQWTVSEFLFYLQWTCNYMCVIKEFIQVRLDILYIKLVFYPFHVHNSKLNYMHMLRCIQIGWKIKSASFSACLGPMEEMGMNFLGFVWPFLYITWVF